MRFALFSVRGPYVCYEKIMYSNFYWDRPVYKSTGLVGYTE